MGKYDGQPKNAEWATTIADTPVEDILSFASDELRIHMRCGAQWRQHFAVLPDAKSVAYGIAPKPPAAIE